MVNSDRINEKLSFARAILDDLKDRPGNRGDDFQRAREEAFLFHLYGARDAFLHEVNEHHKCGLSTKQVKLRKLDDWFQARGKGMSPQLHEIRRFENEPTHTLFRLKEWRDISTHRGGVPRTFFVGSHRHGQHQFHDPSGALTGRHVIEDFEAMLTEVKDLIERLRASLASTPI